MPLAGLSAEQIVELENQLLKVVPENGATIGNKSLRDTLQWENDKYMTVRKRLIEDGRLAVGRGKGGSVRRYQEDLSLTRKNNGSRNGNSIVCQFPDEASLYKIMTSVIEERWVADQPFDSSVVENTDKGGRRKDGVWTRPDVTVAAMTSFTYVPGRHFDIVTFEIKHYSGFNVTAVYEALAHRRAATRSYLLVFIPEQMNKDFEAIISETSEEASRYGIGFIVASNPENFDTWDIIQDATRFKPDPAKMNGFIRNQLSESARDQIVKWFRL